MTSTTELETGRVATLSDVASSVRSPKRKRFLRLRKVVVACTSLGIIATGAVYLVSPTQTAWAITVHHDRGHRRDHPGSVVLYGKATDTNGNGVAGVQIIVTDRDDHDPLATLVSGPDGTYQQTVSLSGGEYVLSVVDGSGHDRHHSHGTQEVDLDPGNTYRADVHLRHFGMFFFLPISSY